MSNILGLAGVTAVLKSVIDNQFIGQELSTILGKTVLVTASAPDSITLPVTSPQLNLFMHQVAPNAAWRNVGYPDFDAFGTRITNPPLALDLHYLMTAYGTTDLEAEVLLGCALQVINQNPVLSRNMILQAIGPGTLISPASTLYSGTVTYKQGALVQNGTSGPYYTSTMDGNTGNALSSSTYWIPYSGNGINLPLTAISGWNTNSSYSIGDMVTFIPQPPAVGAGIMYLFTSALSGLNRGNQPSLSSTTSWIPVGYNSITPSSTVPYITSIPAPSGNANLDVALQGVGLASQVEQLKITPFPLGSEEMSRIWTAVQAHYRPTASFQVSVVLIQSQTPAPIALPVLTVGLTDNPNITNVYPSLTSVLAAGFQQSAYYLTDSITLNGNNIAGLTSASVQALSTQQSFQGSISLSGTTVTPIVFSLAAITNTNPSGPSFMPPGAYQLSVTGIPAGSTSSVTTNTLTMFVAPNITGITLSTITPGSNNVTAMVTLASPVLSTQSIMLIFGNQTAVANSFTGSSSTLSFVLPTLPSSLSTVYVTLQVDNVQNRVINQTPPIHFSYWSFSSTTGVFNP